MLHENWHQSVALSLPTGTAFVNFSSMFRLAAVQSKFVVGRSERVMIYGNFMQCTHNQHTIFFLMLPLRFHNAHHGFHTQGSEYRIFP